MLFSVSTFVTSQVSINASENYQYKLMDVNGRTISIGKGNKGFNTIDMNNKLAGIYIIQLFGTTTKYSERIIKQ